MCCIFFALFCWSVGSMRHKKQQKSMQRHDANAFRGAKARWAALRLFPRQMGNFGERSIAQTIGEWIIDTLKRGPFGGSSVDRPRRMAARVPGLFGLNARRASLLRQ
uniref:Putative secreted protein n=1 Tax=Ixodes ricinus TaxID=34613 RepID=A0A6B0UGL2_IXORI